MEIKDRINEFRESQNISVQAFERKLGISNGSWDSAGTISEKVLIKFLAQFPELNSRWILKGQGSMFETENDNCYPNNEVEHLIKENSKLKLELSRMKSPVLKDKNEKIYNLWMKFMEVTSEMQELYKGEKEG